jgi:hypothetical protein
LYCFITALSKCLDCLMIFTIELPFSLHREPDPDQCLCCTDPDPGGQKNTNPAPYILPLLIFYTTFCQIEGWKTFAKNWQNFAKTVTPFVKVFVFAKIQQSVFVPTLVATILLKSRVPIFYTVVKLLIKNCNGSRGD